MPLLFQLKCKVCGKILGSDENPIVELQKHASENLLAYFDAIPVLSLQPEEKKEEKV